MDNKLTTRKIVLIGMMSAVAYLLMLVEFPILAAAPYLKYDPKNIVIATTGFILGPLASAAICVIVASVHMITAGSSGWIGALMDIVASLAFVLPISIICSNHKRKTLMWTEISLLIGMILATAVMLPLNYMLTPLYTPMSKEAVVGMFMPVIIPFNLVKTAVNSVGTAVICMPLYIAVKKSSFV